MKTLFRAVCLLVGAVLLGSPSFADVHNGSVHANGTSTGTVTSVTYGEGGALASVTFKEAGGQEWTIDNNGDNMGFNDITEHGTSLEKAFNNDYEVTLKVDMGDLKTVTLKRKPKPVTQVPH